MGRISQDYDDLVLRAGPNPAWAYLLHVYTECGVCVWVRAVYADGGESLGLLPMRAAKALTKALGPNAHFLSHALSVPPKTKTVAKKAQNRPNSSDEPNPSAYCDGGRGVGGRLTARDGEVVAVQDEIP